MHKRLGKWGRTIAIGSLRAMTFLFLICAATCHAQAIIGGCMPTNDLTFNSQYQVTDPSGNIIQTTMDPVGWAPGKTYTVSIENGFPVISYLWRDPSGCPDVIISAWQWPQAPNPYTVGAISSDVTLSGLTYVNPTLSTFTASVAGSAQPGEHIFFQLSSYVGVLQYWDIQIQSPQPPNGPNPPKNTCPVPTILGVTPDTWIAGEEYTITVTGTGFITAANATDSCPISVITVSVNTGTVTLSNVEVVNSTTITARVKPADTDPDEPAQVILWAPYNVIDDDDDVGADDDLIPQIVQDKPIANVTQTDAPERHIQAGKISVQITNPLSAFTQGKEKAQ